MLMSWRAKSIQSGTTICNRKRSFPHPQQQKKNDLGERETGQLLNVVSDVTGLKKLLKGRTKYI